MISRDGKGQWRSEIAEEGTEEFAGSIQCDIQTEELPPQHAELYTTAVDTWNNLEGAGGRQGKLQGIGRMTKGQWNGTETRLDHGSMMS